MTIEDSGRWLRPTAFVDSDAPSIVAFARAATGDRADARERAVALYYAVRDGVTYTPYCDFRSPDTYRASAVLAKGAGFCVGKAALLAAVARAEGIPARLCFADVRNHLCTPRLRALGGVGQVSLMWQRPNGQAEVVPQWAFYRPPVTNHGLQGNYYANANWEGAPTLARIDPFLDMYFHITPLPRPYTAEWSGVLVAPQEGPYGLGPFRLSS
jgi:transglutaminase-like putative cysteine protease